MRSRKGITEFSILLLLTLAAVVASCRGERDSPGSTRILQQGIPLEDEIIGEWVAGEIYFAQPPVEVRQSIKSISFGADNIVTWSDVSKGTMEHCRGRYAIMKGNAARGDGRISVTLVVTPEGSENPGTSHEYLLRLTDLEIDYDARFPRESVGKVLKARDSSGKAFLFVRKGREVACFPRQERQHLVAQLK